MTIKELHELFLKHPRISTDSREITPDCIFFALKGDHFNGNRYAQDAFEKGAALAVIDDPEYNTNDSFILVEDVLKTLQDLALYHRSQFRVPVIAITGTNGKTTTKELAASVLSGSLNTVSTPGNLNNHIGVPVTLLAMNSGTEIVITEMGANHPGEIDFLCRIAMPTHGLITNIGKAHLEGFGGFEGVVRTKTELYRFLREHHGTAFLNRDDEMLVSHSDGMNTVAYSLQGDSVVKGELLPPDPFLNMTVHFGNQSLIIHSKLFGNYNAPNILAACCIGYYFHISPEQIKAAIESYIPANNRSQVRQTGRNLLVLDAYNANPSSMEAAIVNFRSSSYPAKVVILGDMLELGKESDDEHLRVLSLLENSGFEHVYLVGPAFTRLNTQREWICFHDGELARLWFEHHPLTGSSVLIKGSRGIRLEQVADVL